MIHDEHADLDFSPASDSPLIDMFGYASKVCNFCLLSIISFVYTTVNEAKPWVGYFLCFFDTARLACPFWLARSCCSVLLALLFSPCLPWAAWFCLLVWLLVSCFWLLGASGCWSPWCF